MDINDPIEFCPAAAFAAEIVRLEAEIDHVARLSEEASLARSLDLMQQLEVLSYQLIIAADEARDRLADADAVSAAGAMAQLLAAIRDTRIRDDAERSRAKDLEARAVRFLANANLYDASFARSLSQTKLGRRLHVVREHAPAAAASLAL